MSEWIGTVRTAGVVRAEELVGPVNEVQSHVRTTLIDVDRDPTVSARDHEGAPHVVTQPTSGDRQPVLFDLPRTLRRGLAPAPTYPGPSAWSMPSPDQADADGVVGVGADLDATTLVRAYSCGIFPWPHDQPPLPWFSPDPRGVVDIDHLRVSSSMRRHLRGCGWTTTCDAAFERVQAGCATDRQGGTWINDEMRRAYLALHRMGWAHSIEVWDQSDVLVGGIYGVQIGAVFTGESMFHKRTNASKVAFIELLLRQVEAGGHLLDVQLTTSHLASLGARDVPRSDFLATLETASASSCRLQLDPLPADGMLARLIRLLEEA